MFKLDPQKGPLFKQVADSVVQQLLKGELRPGDKLHSARELAVKVGVNPNTVIQSFQELEKLEITETKRGLGTFVKRDMNIEKLKLAKVNELTKEFLFQLKSIGVSMEEALLAIRKEVKE